MEIELIFRSSERKKDYQKLMHQNAAQNQLFSARKDGVADWPPKWKTGTSFILLCTKKKLLKIQCVVLERNIILERKINQFSLTLFYSAHIYPGNVIPQGLLPTFAAPGTCNYSFIILAFCSLCVHHDLGDIAEMSVCQFSQNLEGPLCSGLHQCNVCQTQEI